MPLLPLTLTEARVLGCLLEKEMTTPEYYPLTLNGLTLACNQKTNRDPVVSFGEDEVSSCLDRMRAEGAILKVSGGGGRVPKYRHILRDALKLTPDEAPVLCVLLLRGPQTVGEIRSRTGRMRAFDSLEEVENVLDALAGARPEGPPLAIRLSLQPGRKEYRYTHLLCGEPAGEDTQAPAIAPPTSGHEPSSERLAALEEQVDILREELGELRRQFGEFKSQFD